MCSLVMSLCSRDLHMTSSNNNVFKQWFNLHSAWFWIVQHQLVNLVRLLNLKFKFVCVMYSLSGESHPRGHQLIRMGVQISKSLHFSLISEDSTDFKRFL